MFFQDGLLNQLGVIGPCTGSPLRAFENELGAQAPIGFWDPLGFFADGTVVSFLKSVLNPWFQFMWGGLPCPLKWTGRRRATIKAQPSATLRLHPVERVYKIVILSNLVLIVYVASLPG